MRAADAVAVVEDDAGMRKAIERMLRFAGYAATGYPSAEDYLAVASADRAACLILDIHLPGISGFELHRQLVVAGKAPPVIFITAQDDPAARAEAKDSGAVAYLPKPFPGRRLLEAVLEAVTPNQRS